MAKRKSLHTRAKQTREALKRPTGPAGKAGQAVAEGGVKGGLLGQRKKK